MAKPVEKKEVSEHIFPASKITPMAVKWKELNARGRHTEAMVLLEDIIKMSTPMFERLAQHEEYHYTVDLEILVSAAQEKVIKWLLKWNPKKGRIFSWFSKCSKNAYRSELVKVNQYRKRFHVTGDNLEKFHGVEDHESDKRDLVVEFRNRLKGLHCRWGSLQERGAIRYLVECIIDQDNHDKQSAIRSASYAYGISKDMAKFFYSWSLVALRDINYDRIYVPFTQEDLIRHSYTYTAFANLFDGIPFDRIKWIIATHGGCRIQIPTLAQIAKLKQNYQIFTEIDKSDKDPDSVAEVAKRHKRSPRSAQEAFNAMAEVLDPKRSGEFFVYEDSDEPYPD